MNPFKCIQQRWKYPGIERSRERKRNVRPLIRLQTSIFPTDKSPNQPSQSLLDAFIRSEAGPERERERKKKNSRNIACYPRLVVVASNSIRVQRRISKPVYLCGGTSSTRRRRRSKTNGRRMVYAQPGGWGSSGKY